MAVFLVPTVQLALQQAKVLEQNLDDIKVIAGCGNSWGYLKSGHQLLPKEKFVLVSTPASFLILLQHAIISLSKDVSLLIFDECHHSLKNTPYNEILVNFYHEIPEGEKRPRIFAMTASPITNQRRININDVQEKFNDCIVTGGEEVEEFVANSNEIIVEYDFAKPSFDSVIYRELLKDELRNIPMLFRARDTDINPQAWLELYQHILRERATLSTTNKVSTITNALSLLINFKNELGVWCATDIAREYIKAFLPKTNIPDDLDTAFQSSNVIPSDLSPKVVCLLRLLSERISPTFRALVFVEKKAVARAISSLINKLNFGVVAGYVMGHGKSKRDKSRMGIDGMFMEQQEQVFEQFRNGSLNLLVCTKVAEEGVDIPACNLVIIFDLFRSLSGYVQSRGRARDLNNSDYIIMTQRNDFRALEYITKAKVVEGVTKFVAKEFEHSNVDSLSASVIKTKQATNQFLKKIEILMSRRHALETAIGAKCTLQAAKNMLMRWWASTFRRLRSEGTTLRERLISDPELPGLTEAFQMYIENRVAQEQRVANTTNFTSRLRKSKEDEATESDDTLKDLVDTRLTSLFAGNQDEFNAMINGVCWYYVRIKFVGLQPQQGSESATSNLVSKWKIGVRKSGFDIGDLEKLIMKGGEYIGPIRLTKKSAEQSCCLEICKILYMLGSLNEHLLPTLSTRKTFTFFTFQKILQKKMPHLTTSIPEIHDESSLTEYKKRRPRLLDYNNSITRENWEDVVTEKEMRGYGIGLDVSLLSKAKFHVILFSFGPELEVYTRGSDPPICITSDLTDIGSVQFPNNYSSVANHNYYFPTLNHFACFTGEPRQTFAILTREKIPPIVHEFLVWLYDQPCKVEVIEFYENKERHDFSVELSESEINQVKLFQKAFWSNTVKFKSAVLEKRLDNNAMEMESLGVDAIEKDVLTDKFEIEPNSEVYMIVPMIGTPVAPVLLRDRQHPPSLASRVLRNDDQAAKKETDEIKWPKLNEMKQPIKCLWELDWKLIDQVVNFEKDSKDFGGGSGVVGGVSLLHWIIGLTEIINLHYRKCNSKSQTNSDDVSNQLDFWEVSSNDSESDRGYENYDVDNEFEAYREPNSKPNLTSSFNILYEKVLSRSKSLSPTEIREFDLQSYPKKVVEKLNLVLSQTMVKTPHNGIKYSLERINMDVFGYSEFQLSRSKSKDGKETTSYEKYAESLGYTVNYPHINLIEAHQISGTKNFVIPSVKSAPSTSPINLLPETCRLLPFSRETYRLSTLIPSTTHFIENALLISEFQEELQLPNVKPTTLLSAFTAPSTKNPDNYERLETLGDAVLKYAVSADLYLSYADSDEGDLSFRRGKLVSNRNLFAKCLEKKLEEIMFVDTFATKWWCPSGWVPVLKGNDGGNSDEQSVYKSRKGMRWRVISQKMLADFVESLIGVCFIDSGMSAACKFLKWMGLVGDAFICNEYEATEAENEEEDDEFEEGAVESNSGNMDSTLSKPLPNDPLGTLVEIETKLGYKFKDKYLLLEALTHSSYVEMGSYIVTKSYERLEYLGDAVLDCVLTRFFYKTYPSLPPSQLTELRQAAVNNESLSRLAVHLELYKHFRVNSAVVEKNIAEYLEFLDAEQDYLDSITTNDGNSAIFGASYTSHEGPKVLGDLFEGVCGALLVDMNWDIDSFWKVIKPIVNLILETRANLDVVSKSPIRLWHEVLQKKGFVVDDLTFDLLNHSHLPNVLPEQNFKCQAAILNDVVAVGFGNTAQVAKRQACINGLEWISDNSEYLETLLEESRRLRNPEDSKKRQNSTPEPLKKKKTKHQRQSNASVEQSNTEASSSSSTIKRRGKYRKETTNVEASELSTPVPPPSRPISNATNEGWNLGFEALNPTFEVMDTEFGEVVIPTQHTTTPSPFSQPNITVSQFAQQIIPASPFPPISPSIYLLPPSTRPTASSGQQARYHHQSNRNERR
ncbi:hypothetical protein HK098_004630 [Nowakowskiella sp. JEL0407]|nr:hypothetical protein HK098_004630 [Nowakowskiella sp. JEL0407]